MVVTVKITFHNDVTFQVNCSCKRVKLLILCQQSPSEINRVIN